MWRKTKVGKTKTAFVGGVSEEKLSGAEKYKLRKQKREQEELKAQESESKTVDADGFEVAETSEEAAVKTKGPRVRGVKYTTAKQKIDRSKLYSVENGVKLAKETSISKFDGSVELHLVVRKEGLSVQVALPHSTGKTKKVVLADEAVISELKKGEINFDVILATADMMPKLVPFAKLLGPRGLMPNPKNGTLIKDKKDAAKFSADTLTVKTERKQPVVHTIVGKVSLENAQLVDNVEAVLEAVGKKQIEKAYITTSMGPSIKLAL